MPKVETVLQGFTVGTDQGRLGFCTVTLIRGSRNILVDAAQLGRRQLLQQRLAALGVAPRDIHAVFLTHAHWDHILNMDLFPNAEFLIHPAEREYAKDPHEGDWATPKYTSKILESYRLREVKEGQEIDDGVRVIETPGHSPGSMSVLVETPQGRAALCGDTMHNSWSAVSGQPLLVFWDVEKAKASIRKILDRSDVIYPGHDRPFRLVAGRVHYVERTGIKIFGLPLPGEGEGSQGVTFGLEPPLETMAFLPE
jgi:glyoxylase-like metal-dependent hydrolase (beta-lactamase superfamily II)